MAKKSIEVAKPTIEVDKIHFQDCLEGLRAFPDKCIDLVVTDPPYEIDAGGNRPATGKHAKLGNSLQGMLDELTEANITSGFDLAILDELMRVCKVPNMYIWCNGKQIPMYIDYFVRKHGCVFDIIIWNKPNVAPLFGGAYLKDKEYCLYFRKGGYCQPASKEAAKTVYTYPVNTRDKKLFDHPTIKPESILRNLIANSSHEGDIVLDPFMGSGSTAVAAQSLNRRYVGFEIYEKFYTSSVARLESSRLESELFGGDA
jgi:site-specific DNA-methyltransferase (adenine-specific)